MLVDLEARVVTLVRQPHPGSPLSRDWWGRTSSVEGTVEDQAVLERMLAGHAVMTVFHLAAQTQVGVANRSPIPTYESNVRGTWALLEAARHCRTVEQIIVASSDKAYGTQPALPYVEDMPLAAVNPYDVSKACADLVARSFAKAFDSPVVVTRCGNFFGPVDVNWMRLVPGTIRSVLSGEPPVVRSDGTMTRDYLYVVDAALAYLQLAEALAGEPSLAGEAFNFSVERPLTVLELIALVQSAAGTSLVPEIQATASHEIDHQFLSATKAHHRLGWAPRYSMEQAIELTVAGYRRFLAEGT